MVRVDLDNLGSVELEWGVASELMRRKFARPLQVYIWLHYLKVRFFTDGIVPYHAEQVLCQLCGDVAPVTINRALYRLEQLGLVCAARRGWLVYSWASAARSLGCEVSWVHEIDGAQVVKLNGLKQAMVCLASQPQMALSKSRIGQLLGMSASTIKRHRRGADQIDWGVEYYEETVYPSYQEAVRAQRTECVPGTNITLYDYGYRPAPLKLSEGSYLLWRSLPAVARLHTLKLFTIRSRRRTQRLRDRFLQLIERGAPPRSGRGKRTGRATSTVGPTPVVVRHPGPLTTSTSSSGTATLRL